MRMLMIHTTIQNEYYAIYYYPKSSIVPSQAMKVTITTSMPANQTYS